MTKHTATEIVKTTEKYLRTRGSESPLLDARLLLCKVLGVTTTELFMRGQQPLTDDEVASYRELVRRRSLGEPVAYILGKWGFRDLMLQVDARCLVPRPETEQLVSLVLDFARRFDHRQWRLVDVGTGSGAIALSLAKELPEARVLALDVSADALDVARANCEQTQLGERVKFRRSDLLETLSDRPETAEIVVSNPPYIGERERPSLAPTVREFEPSMALFSGDDGLDVIRRLIPQAHAALVPGGAFFMEFGHEQGAAVAQLARAHFADVRIERDLDRKDRMLVAVKAGELPWPRLAVVEPRKKRNRSEDFVVASSDE